MAGASMTKWQRIFWSVAIVVGAWALLDLVMGGFDLAKFVNAWVARDAGLLRLAGLALVGLAVYEAITLVTRRPRP